MTKEEIQKKRAEREKRWQEQCEKMGETCLSSVTGGKGTEYTMRLTAVPFEKLRNGSKVIELRLYDEKRKRIKTGDTILFISLKDPSDTLLTQVTGIYTFASFEDLYRALPLEDLGYSAEEVAAASPKDMEEFYSPEEQAQYGVVGFRLGLLPQR